jgi:hypothetical protein
MLNHKKIKKFSKYRARGIKLALIGANVSLFKDA